MPPHATQEETVIAEEVHELMTPKELRNRILDGHTHLRFGMGVIALAFPPALWLGGLLLTDTRLQGSMSAYYHTPMRNLFVGPLFALGGFLYLYKGFSRKENVALNLAGVFAVGVAIFPMAPRPGAESVTFTAPLLHAACAILFFFALAYVCLARASDTLHLIRGPSRAAAYHYTYKVIGISLIVLPVTAAALAYKHGHLVGPADQRPVIFALELVATWVFGAFWLLKSLEIRGTQADRTAFHDRTPAPVPSRTTSR